MALKKRERHWSYYHYEACRLLQINQSRSVTNALAGQVAGIIAVQRSGEPGNDASDFWIRGISSFGSGTTPLVLVDGIERSLSNLSPEEIESFSVLKDATATAVYGVKGANGVILIQTKRGQIGKPRIQIKLIMVSLLRLCYPNLSMVPNIWK